MDKEKDKEPAQNWLKMLVADGLTEAAGAEQADGTETVAAKKTWLLLLPPAPSPPPVRAEVGRFLGLLPRPMVAAACPWPPLARAEVRGFSGPDGYLCVFWLRPQAGSVRHFFLLETSAMAK